MCDTRTEPHYFYLIFNHINDWLVNVSSKSGTLEKWELLGKITNLVLSNGCLYML